MTANPEMFCKITDLTTYVDREAGYAEVFCNMETTGRPKGIIRTSVAILEFRCEKRGRGTRVNGSVSDSEAREALMGQRLQWENDGFDEMKALHVSSSEGGQCRRNEQWHGTATPKMQQTG